VTRRERPPAVARHRNTALWLPVAALALFGWSFVTEDLPASRPERVDRPDEVAVDGRVVEETTGGALEVRYTHPVTEQEVTAEVYVWDADLAPSARPTGWRRGSARRRGARPAWSPLSGRSWRRWPPAWRSWRSPW
jgi:hypothetical protein